MSGEPFPEDLRSDIFDIVSDAVQWQLPVERWDEVEELVLALHTAVRTGDRHAVARAVGDLELAAPLRIRPIGGEPRCAAPFRMKDLAQQVVHEIGEDLETDVGHGPAEDRREGSGSTDGARR